MNNIKQQIIESIRTNHMSTEEIGDVLGKTGVVEDVFPVASGLYTVGEIQYIYAHSNTNWPVHEQIRSLEPGKVLFVDAIEVDDYAIFGELVSMYIIDKCKVPAIVVNGKMRDLEGLKKRNFAVWCKGITPMGCFNKNIQPTENIIEQAELRRAKFDGAILVADDSGVVVIPKEEISEKMLDRLSLMREQEKIWFDCVENKGWNTYDTVCLKKYKDE